MYVHTYYTQYIVPIFSQTSLRKLAMDCFPKLLDPTESFLCCLSLTVGVKATTGDDRWMTGDDRWRWRFPKFFGTPKLPSDAWKVYDGFHGQFRSFSIWNPWIITGTPMTLEIDDSIESLFARKWSKWCCGRILRPAALDVAALGSGAVHCSRSYSLRNQGNVLGIGLNHLESPTFDDELWPDLVELAPCLCEAIENLIGEDNGPGASQLFETLWPGSWEFGHPWNPPNSKRVELCGKPMEIQRSLIGVPVLFAGLWGVYHRAEPHVSSLSSCMENQRVTVEHQVELCSKMSKMQKRRLVRSLFIKPCEVRLCWYYLVASFIIDLAGSLGLIFLWSDCLRLKRPVSISENYIW